MSCSRRLVLLSALALPLLPACSPGLGSVSSALMSRTDTSKLIPIERAISAATARVAGTPIAAVLEIDDQDEPEPPAYEVVIFASDTGDMMEVEVHAETGEVLEVERADDGAEQGSKTDSAEGGS
ncbi:MAG: PepSY domain-containing protein [Deltaproteobacteria bacterium]|nr:PepSY domain-containing protein [Deltaproteobacteria bacterium]